VSNEEGGGRLWMCHYVIFGNSDEKKKEEKRKIVFVCVSCKGGIKRYGRKYPY